MATKVSIKDSRAFIQYSKKMCTAVAIFWMVYRICNYIVVLIRPDTAAALADLCAGVDTIMIVNMSTYTLNSSTEKDAVAYTKRNSNTSEKEDEEDSNG